MSNDCEKQITRRQMIISQNVRTDPKLWKACKSDFLSNKCFDKVLFYDKLYDNPHYFMANVLTCLENAQRNGTNVTSECSADVFERRTMLMQDYRLSPNIVEFCMDEIRDLCKNGIERNGKTLECLFRNSRISQLKDEYFDEDCTEEVTLYQPNTVPELIPVLG